MDSFLPLPVFSPQVLGGFYVRVSKDPPSTIPTDPLLPVRSPVLQARGLATLAGGFPAVAKGG